MGFQYGLRFGKYFESWRQEMIKRLEERLEKEKDEKLQYWFGGMRDLLDNINNAKWLKGILLLRKNTTKKTPSGG